MDGQDLYNAIAGETLEGEKWVEALSAHLAILTPEETDLVIGARMHLDTGSPLTPSAIEKLRHLYADIVRRGHVGILPR